MKFRNYLVAGNSIFSAAGSFVVTCPSTGLVDSIRELVICVSFFLLSSWAREKVTRTIANKTTTIFLSDKIAFMTGL